MIGVIVGMVLSWFVPCKPVSGPKAVFVPPGFEQPQPVVDVTHEPPVQP